MPSLEDAFASRKLPTQVVRLPVDADEYQRIARELAAAEWTLDEARSRGAVDTAAQRADVERLRAELDAAPAVEVKLTAIPPAEWEGLVAAHPPTPAELARGAQWDVPTFRPALLAVSVVTDGPVPDWERLAKEGRMTAGELQALFDSAVMLNVRGLSAAVGKGR